MLEPYALKGACTVLRGGKAVTPYLSQIETLVFLTVNDEWWLLVACQLVYDVNTKPFRLVSTTAKLKTKKLVGLGANEVKHVI